MSKGTRVIVTGRLEQLPRENDGERRSRTEVIADESGSRPNVANSSSRLQDVTKRFPPTGLPSS